MLRSFCFRIDEICFTVLRNLSTGKKLDRSFCHWRFSFCTKANYFPIREFKKKNSLRTSKGFSWFDLFLFFLLQNMQILEEEKTKLDAFCEQSLKNVSMLICFKLRVHTTCFFTVFALELQLYFILSVFIEFSTAFKLI